jgi:DNA-binding CsgD family transcriptional regulator
MAVSPERDSEPSYLLDSPTFMNSIEIVGRREDLIDAYVPISYINTEEVPVDLPHAKDLADQMDHEATLRGREGQLSPTLIGDVAGEARMPIMDGFHRTHVLKSRAARQVFSTIRPHTSWEEVYDIRIVAASTHRSVKFARVVEWIDASWGLTPWANEITALQAFSMATNKRISGSTFKVESNQIPDILEWIKERCEKWQRSPSSVFADLQVARQVAPDLVREARATGQSKTRLPGTISPQHLKVIGGTLPNEHDKQRLVVEVIKGSNLSVDEAKAVASVVRGTATIERAREILENGLWRGVSSVSAPAGRPRESGERVRERKSPSELLDDLRHSLLINEIELAKSGLDLAVLRGRYLPDRLSEPRLSNFPRVKGLESPLRPWTSDDIRNFNFTLEPTIERTKKELAPALTEGKVDEVVDRVMARFARAIESGGLGFVRLDMRHRDVIVRLYTTVLSDELQLRDKSDTEESKELPADPSETGTISAIGTEYLLPELEPIERRVFVLGAAFGLSNHTIARLVNIEPVQVLGIYESAISKRELKPVQLSSRGSSPRQLAYSEKEDAVGITQAEGDVLALVAMGMKNEEIARARFISPETVKSHVRHLLEKTGTRSRAGLVSFGYENGLLRTVEDLL